MSLLIKGGTILTTTGEFQADIFVEDETVTAVGRNLSMQADEVVDAAGKDVMDPEDAVFAEIPHLPEIGVSTLKLFMAYKGSPFCCDDEAIVRLFSGSSAAGASGRHVAGRGQRWLLAVGSDHCANDGGYEHCKKKGLGNSPKISNATCYHGTDYYSYEGYPMKGIPEKVFLRGKLMAESGKFVGPRATGRRQPCLPYGLCLENYRAK